MDKHSQWNKLQAAYRMADAALDTFELDMISRYGTRDNSRHYASRGDQTKRDKLRARLDKAYDRSIAWLKANSPWDWYGGTSAHWLCSELSAEMALSETAPVRPAEAAGYGMPDAPRTLERA